MIKISKISKKCNINNITKTKILTSVKMNITKKSINKRNKKLANSTTINHKNDNNNGNTFN